mmetsp:Transcript_3684/g.5553  ORF Transcript_3684/g.5553 Transcript_3684/m.5553 type:complete len:323 (+) Transcript_3684:629-1597(+)
MEKSPQKWKTAYRDQFRQFVQSPHRIEQQHAEVLEAQASYDNQICSGELNGRDMDQAQQQYEEAVRPQYVNEEAPITEIKMDVKGNRNNDLQELMNEQAAPVREHRNDRKKVHIQNDDSEQKPRKKREKPLTEEEKIIKAKAAEINATTRWLADSAFTTYFGKPAFHAYGKANVNPTCMSQKMLTHNINSVTGTQKSKFQQVYDSAYIAGVQKTSGLRVPQLPVDKKKIGQAKTLSAASILPKSFDDQKKETKKATKKKQVSIRISKPSLTINGFEITEKDKDEKSRLAQKEPIGKRAISVGRVASSMGKSQRSKSRGQSSA